MPRHHENISFGQTFLWHYSLKKWENVNLGFTCLVVEYSMMIITHFLPNVSWPTVAPSSSYITHFNLHFTVIFYLKNAIPFFKVVNILETLFMNEKIAENGVKENMVRVFYRYEKNSYKIAEMWFKRPS